MINNILKKIEKANEVQEVQLEKHDVELNLVANVDKAYKDAMVAREKAQEVFFNTKKAIQAAIDNGLKQIKEYKSINERALPLFNELEKVVKEIGVPLAPTHKNNKENVQAGLKNSFPMQIKTLESIKF